MTEFDAETIPSIADLYPMSCGPRELEALLALDSELRREGTLSPARAAELSAAVAAAREAEAVPLPGWAEMDELDRGAALMYLAKADREGGDYARSNYPCRYLVDPRLVALDPAAACAHADVFQDRAQEMDADEYVRLCDLALDEGYARRANGGRS